MAHIPDDSIFRRVEHVMKCNGELDNAQSRAKVPPRLTHRIQHELTDFVGEVYQILFGHGSQRSEIGLNVFQQRC